MSYFADVYLRIYSCIASFNSWFFWGMLFFILGAIAGFVQDSKNPYKKRILYAYIVALISSFIIRILLWIFLPSPEYLGLLK